MTGTRRIIRRWAIFGGAVTLLIVVLIGIEHVRGAWGLHRRLAALESRGEKLAIKDLRPANVLPEKNALAALLVLTNQIRQLDAFLGRKPPISVLTSNGNAIVTTQLAEWSYKTETNSWARISAAMSGNEDLFAAISAALQRPGWDDDFDYDQGFSNFRLRSMVEIKICAGLLQVAALNDLHDGQIDATVDRLVDLTRLVRRQADSRLIISQLVRIATGSMNRFVTWEALRSGQLREKHLVRLQEAWQGMDFPKDMAVAIEMERAMTLQHFEDIASRRDVRIRAIGEREQAGVFFGEDSGPPISGFIYHWFHVPLWRMAWFRQDELNALNQWQAVIETDRAILRSSLKAARGRVEALGTGEIEWVGLAFESDRANGLYDRFRYLLSGTAFGINSATLIKALKAQTESQLVVTAIALERYRLKHGALPDGLSELLPEFLSALPLDSIDGQPLRYRSNGEGSFALYSIGEDCVDDGGDFGRSPGRANLNLWTAKDAVWPMAAAAEEAATLAHQK